MYLIDNIAIADAPCAPECTKQVYPAMEDFAQCKQCSSEHGKFNRSDLAGIEVLITLNYSRDSQLLGATQISLVDTYIELLKAEGTEVRCLCSQCTKVAQCIHQEPPGVAHDTFKSVVVKSYMPAASDSQLWYCSCDAALRCKVTLVVLQMHLGLKAHHQYSGLCLQVKMVGSTYRLTPSAAKVVKYFPLDTLSMRYVAWEVCVEVSSLPWFTF